MIPVISLSLDPNVILFVMLSCDIRTNRTLRDVITFNIKVDIANIYLAGCMQYYEPWSVCSNWSIDQQENCNSVVRHLIYLV